MGLKKQIAGKSCHLAPIYRQCRHYHNKICSCRVRKIGCKSSLHFRFQSAGCFIMLYPISGSF
ncbi:hypothetical protein HMPREF9098_1570 [Kingella denitrificans ATCC 33394]|uniref:Uncharacterized protein n=1 Tax=Kingella denitrificans ATCC 33394 TaxID=888741 RepID=F0F0D5_9NEIS|nr:hypothetical protein HMPREF9098_1570 [Kingella denitrificans ATCC 33394]